MSSAQAVKTENLNWRQQTVVNLSSEPESWVLLGELFAGVEDLIPPHLAIRRTQYNSKGGLPDIGLHTARWRMFLSHVRPLVERQTIPDNERGHIHRLQRSEFVRLKHNEIPCQECGGKRYLSHWADRNQKTIYKCPTCENLKVPTSVEEATVPSVVVPLRAVPPVIRPKPKPKPKRRGKYTTPPLHLVTAPPQLPKPKPKPIRPVRPVRSPEENAALLALPPMHTLNSLSELWGQYAATAKTPIPSFQSNPKLRKMLYRAVEAGAYDQYKRINLFQTAELQDLQLSPKVEAIWYIRANMWMNKFLTAGPRQRWEPILAEAFGVGSLYIVTLTLNNRLSVIYNEMEKIRAKLEPQPKSPAKPPRPPRQIWAGARKAINRLFVR